MNHESEQPNIDYRATLNVTRVHNALARENPDRLAESRPVSLWIFLGAMGVTAIGAIFFGANVGFGADSRIDYNKFGLSYKPVAPPAVVPLGAGVDVPLAKIGEKVYKNKCVACHQLNGLGQPGVYPPLDGSEWVLGSTERLASLVGYGLQGPVTVKGQTYGSAFMPPHGPPVLSPKEFAGVLSYVRTAWSNKATEIPLESVTDFLKRTSGRTAMNTEGELKGIPEDKMLIGPAPAAAPAPATTPPAPTGTPSAPAGTVPPAPSAAK